MFDDDFDDEEYENEEDFIGCPSCGSNVAVVETGYVYQNQFAHCKYDCGYKWTQLIEPDPLTFHNEHPLKDFMTKNEKVSKEVKQFYKELGHGSEIVPFENSIDYLEELYHDDRDRYNRILKYSDFNNTLLWKDSINLDKDVPSDLIKKRERFFQRQAKIQATSQNEWAAETLNDFLESPKEHTFQNVIYVLCMMCEMDSHLNEHEVNSNIEFNENIDVLPDNGENVFGNLSLKSEPRYSAITYTEYNKSNLYSILAILVEKYNIDTTSVETFIEKLHNKMNLEYGVPLLYVKSENDKNDGCRPLEEWQRDTIEKNGGIENLKELTDKRMKELHDGIEESGVRNSTHLSKCPKESPSKMINSESSGIEPLFNKIDEKNLSKEEKELMKKTFEHFIDLDSKQDNSKLSKETLKFIKSNSISTNMYCNDTIFDKSQDMSEETMNVLKERIKDVESGKVKVVYHDEEKQEEFEKYFPNYPIKGRYYMNTKIVKKEVTEKNIFEEFLKQITTYGKTIKELFEIIKDCEPIASIGNSKPFIIKLEEFYSDIKNNINIPSLIDYDNNIVFMQISHKSIIETLNLLNLNVYTENAHDCPDDYTAKQYYRLSKETNEEDYNDFIKDEYQGDVEFFKECLEENSKLENFIKMKNKSNSEYLEHIEKYDGFNRKWSIEEVQNWLDSHQSKRMISYHDYQEYSQLKGEKLDLFFHKETNTVQVFTSLISPENPKMLTFRIENEENLKLTKLLKENNIKFDTLTSLSNKDFITLNGTGKVSGEIYFPKSDEENIPEGKILVIPTASEDYFLPALSAMNGNGCIITEKGSQTSHLVINSKEFKFNLILVDNATNLFKDCDSVTIDLDNNFFDNDN